MNTLSAMGVDGEDDDESADELDRASFVHATKLARLERQLYGHVLAAVDLDRIAALERELVELLEEAHALPDVLALDVAAQLVERAIQRVAFDPGRYANLGPPPGITKAEIAAVAFDESCPFCITKAAAMASRSGRGADRRESTTDNADHADHADADHDAAGHADCALCTMLAKQWRAKHADKLASSPLLNPALAAKRALDSPALAAVTGATAVARRSRNRGRPS